MLRGRHRAFADSLRLRELRRASLGHHSSVSLDTNYAARSPILRDARGRASRRQPRIKDSSQDIGQRCVQRTSRRATSPLHLKELAD